MSAGLSVVVSDIPANRQLVDPEVEGLVAAPKDAEKIGEALRSLLANPEARRRMGAAGRTRIAKSFSTERVVRMYESLFARLLSRAEIEAAVENAS